MHGMHGPHSRFRECDCGCGLIGFFPPLMSKEEEIKALERHKETLEKQLERVNERITSLSK